MNENDTLNEDLQRLTEALVDLQAQLLVEDADALQAQATEIAALRSANKQMHEQASLVYAENATLRADAERVIGVDEIIYELICFKPSDAEGQPVAKLNWYRSLVQAGIDAARGTT